MDKWEEVENIDLSRRKPEDWARIYKVNLLNSFNDDRLWSEFEWAYHFCNSDYTSMDGDFETLAEYEMRAMDIKRDLFLGATPDEKKILKDRYIETEYVRRKLNTI